MTRLLPLLESAPVATVIQVLAFVIVALVGGVITIVHPGTLTFEDYAKYITGLSIGNGLLGIGRGALKGLSASALTKPGPDPR